MELIINELDYDNLDLEESNIEEQIQSSFEKIPENNVPIKVVKKDVRFLEPVKPMNQVIPKENARMIRPQNSVKKPQISYEDILSKMGMFVADGKLHLLDDKTPQQKEEFKRHIQQRNTNNTQNNNIQNNIQQSNQNIPQNSYIYNKYFKEEFEPEQNIRRPRNVQEYKQMLIMDILQKQRIKQIKSTKLIMPTSNINIAAGNSANLNKLFNFSKR